MTDLSDLYKTLHDIQLKLKAPKNKFNSYGEFNYRTAEGILSAVKPYLPEGTVVLINSNNATFDSSIIAVTTASLANEKGCISATAYAREEADRKKMNPCQLSGSAISFSKKYALCNLFAIDDSELDPDNPSEEELETEPLEGSEKARLWNAIKAYAKKHNEDAKAISAELFKDKPASQWTSEELTNVAKIYEGDSDEH